MSKSASPEMLRNIDDPSLFLHLNISAGGTIYQVGIPIVKSANDELLKRLSRSFIGHSAYGLSVELYPRPHVLIPIPPMTSFMLLDESLTVLVPIVSNQLRIVLTQETIGVYIDFYRGHPRVTLAGTDVLSDWN